MGWAVAALYVILIAVVIFGPKPPKPKAAALEDFEVPTAEEGRTISIVLGTREIKAPNIVWYGDLKTKSMGEGRFRYYLGVHMVVCHSGIDAIVRITAGDKIVSEEEYPSSHDGILHTLTESVWLDQLFGGNDSEGGLGGDFDIDFGWPNQPMNTYLFTNTSKNTLVEEGTDEYGDAVFVPPTIEELENPYSFTYPLGNGTEETVYPPEAVAYYEETIAAMELEFYANYATRVFVPPTMEQLYNPYKVSYPAGNPWEPWITIYPPEAVAYYEETIVAMEAEFYANSAVAETIVVPNYRGVVSVILKSFWVGNSPYVKAWKFTVKATTMDTFGNPLWYQEKAQIGEYDLNPAHMLYLALTDQNWGLGMSPVEIDQLNFRRVADIFHDEQFGLSFLINEEQTVEEFVSDVLKHINGAIILCSVTGRFQIKLLRGDYDEDALEVFGTDKILKVKSYQRSSLSDVVNSLVIKFWDFELGEVSTYRLQDLASIAMQGGEVEKTLEYAGVTNKRIAGLIAARELKMLSTPLTAMELEVDRCGAEFNVGDVFKVNWEPYTIDEMVVRIVRIIEGDFNKGSIMLQVIEDVFADAEAVFAVEPTYVDPIKAATPLDFQYIEEAPYAYLLKTLWDHELLAMSYPKGRVIGFGFTLNTDAYSYMLDALWNGGSYTGHTHSFTALAVMLTPLTRETIYATLKMPEGSEAYTGVAVIDEEYINIVGYNNQGQALLDRGVYDTFPEPHASTTRVWLLDNSYISYIYHDFVSGDEPLVRARPRTALGTLPAEDADAVTVSITGRAFLPHPPAKVILNNEYFPLTIPSGTFTVYWQPRDKILQNGEVISWYSAVGTAEAGTTYNIRFYDTSDESLIEESTGLTSPTYDANPLAASVRMELETVVNGLTSRVFKYEFTRPDLDSGYGYDYGQDYGGA